MELEQEQDQSRSPVRAAVVGQPVVGGVPGGAKTQKVTYTCIAICRCFLVFHLWEYNNSTSRAARFTLYFELTKKICPLHRVESRCCWLLVR